MKGKVSNLDLLKIFIIFIVFGLNFILFDNIRNSFLVAFISFSVLFQINSKVIASLALILLSLIPISIFLEFNRSSENLSIIVYYILLAFVCTEIVKKYKDFNQKIENYLDKNLNWIFNKIILIPNYIWILLFSFGALILVSGRYFIKSSIPHNSFLDMGGAVIHTDIWQQFRIGWFYQFGQIWNNLTSSWAVLYTEFLSWLTGNFYLGIKVHQLFSIVLGAIGVIIFFRSIMPKLENRVANISSQVLVALIYVLNPFYLSVLNGVVEFGVAYSLLPWIIWAWLRIIRKSKVKWWENILRIIVLGVLVSFTTVVSGITLVFTNIIPLMVVMLGLILVKFDSNRELFRRFILFISVWGVVFLMGLHVLAPTFFGYRVNSEILDDSQVGRKTAFVKDYYSPNLLEVLYLQNKEGIVSEEIGYSIFTIPFLLKTIWIFLSSLGILSILWIRRNKYILPIWLGTSLAGYLSLGYSWSWLYRLLDKYFPYFWGLRTPGRFMMIFVLGISILSAVVWYYVANEFKTRAWKLGLISFSCIFLFLLIISSRYQARQMYTFTTIPSIDYHLPNIEKAKKTLDNLNPNMDYRILDLTRDDDGAWNHTRIMSVEQRYFNEFDKVLIKSPAKDWAKILRDNNIKYIITSNYDDYCKDRFENNKNLISCYLLQKKDILNPLNLGLGSYKIYELKDTRPYVFGEGISQNFSYNPIVKTNDKNTKVSVAETYSPQFWWTCNGDKLVKSTPENKGLVQSSILPANSECKFGYHKSLEIKVADWIFYILFGVAVGVWIWTIIKFFIKKFKFVKYRFM